MAASKVLSCFRQTLVSMRRVLTFCGISILPSEGHGRARKYGGRSEGATAQWPLFAVSKGHKEREGLCILGASKNYKKGQAYYPGEVL